MKNKEQTAKDANGIAPPDPGDRATHAAATIDQVRDLLFGGAQRSIQNDLTELRAEMQENLQRLQDQFTRELADLQAKVVELDLNTEQKRLASQRDIGAAISELGATITALGSGRGGR